MRQTGVVFDVTYCAISRRRAKETENVMLTKCNLEAVHVPCGCLRSDDSVVEIQVVCLT